jgi:hypothetical protein
VVDLLDQHRREGTRFEPTELIEEGMRIAVALTVSNPSWHGEAATDVFKVFSFEDDHVVLLQDCTGREDARAYLAS